jgi:tRNA-specific 2-thiouridylase
MAGQREVCRKALVAMSGGVDSSVAAVLMQRAGYDCTGATMKLLVEEPVASPTCGIAPTRGATSGEDASAAILPTVPTGGFAATAPTGPAGGVAATAPGAPVSGSPSVAHASGFAATTPVASATPTGGVAATASASGCCSLADCEDARAVCALLQIPYYVFDFTEDFQRDVIVAFIDGYRRGCTPNPCIACNRFLKFEKLLARALLNGYECLVTGHYARITYDERSGRWQLAKGKDPRKDQSYVLYAMTQEQLAHTRLPLGAYTKREVRAIAAAAGLRVAGKPESQDICFVGSGGSYADWIIARVPELARPGDILDEDGRRLGEHSGVIHYTIGQRRRIRIAAPEPLYVKAIDARANSITVCRESGLYGRRVLLNDINLISVAQLEGSRTLSARHRYCSGEVPARVRQTGPDELEVAFMAPEKALTPGQALVLYNGVFVFGGGTIAAVH